VSFWTEYLGGEVGSFDVRGIATRCAILGAGRPLLFLHGRGGHLETFIRNVRAISSQYRTIAIDMLGHGQTAFSPGGNYGLDALGSHVIDVIDVLAPGVAIDVVGQSLGGWVAAHLAIAHPERFRRLILIEPSGLVSVDERRSIPAVAERMGASSDTLNDPTPSMIRKRLAMLLADPDAVDEEMIATRGRLYQLPERRAVHRAVARDEDDALLLRPQRLAELKLPVLFMRGEFGNTPLVVIEAAVAACRDARLVTIGGARQWPQFERPAAVNAAIMDFLLPEEA
jgi:2-hydroxy-6-oxonona-2,4-dienedioate hydrolase